MNIKELQKEAHAIATEKGWHDEPRSFGDLISLCHSELSEALEEYRNNGTGKDIYFDGLKPLGIAIEFADVIIRIADMAAYYGIDLEDAIRIKMGYNRTRPYRHGNKNL